MNVPFKVRRSQDIESELGLNSVPDGFVQIPIYNFMDTVWEDPLSVPSCNYVLKVKHEREDKDSSYPEEAIEKKNELAPQFSKFFNNTAEFFKSLHFDPFGGYTDLVVAELFEGVPHQGMNWTTRDKSDMAEVLDRDLDGAFTRYSR